MKLRANTNFADLAKQFDQMSGRTNEKEKDPRFFVPGKDKEGNIAVVIRFLPSPDSPAVVEKATHFIKGEHGKYQEYCPKAYGKSCPACSMAGKAYGDGDKNAYKKWGNSSKYIGNIAVINDINNPENNGKVFLWEFGATVYKQIDAKINPQNALTKSSIVFDYKTGENYNLVGKRDEFREPVSGKMIEFDSFKDGSGFVGKVELTDEEIESFDKQLKDMAEFLPENNLKSWNELKEKLDAVMGGVRTTSEQSTPSSAPVADQSESDYNSINKLLGQSESSGGDEDEDEAALLARLNALTR